jgi:hypothetical protein
MLSDRSSELSSPVHAAAISFSCSPSPNLRLKKAEPVNLIKGPLLFKRVFSLGSCSVMGSSDIVKSIYSTRKYAQIVAENIKSLNHN